MKIKTPHSMLLQSAALAVLCLVIAPVPAHAKKLCDLPVCEDDVRGKVLDNSTQRQTAVQPNTETSSEKSDLEAGEGFSLSVDGEVVAGTQTVADEQRKADVDLEQADVQVKFDGLDVRPMLNVSTVPASETYVAGEAIEFQVSLNYGAWISRADIIISEFNGFGAEKIAVVSVDESGHATWQVPASQTSKLSYVLRVYDREGRYDETQALPLTAKSDDIRALTQEDGVVKSSSAPAGLNEDRTALRNIPITGGAVTVFGRGVNKDSEVYAFGENVPVDPQGNFLIQRILPPGDHTVGVEVADGLKNSIDFSRQINIPTNDWYYVGLADLTLGKRFGSKEMKETYPGEYKGIYSKGRVAFYLKGKMQGRTILTAALDTGEHDIKNLLKNLDEKDPRRFLKRIDPDDYYPIYGDDSSMIEDAPTAGRFYVRLQRDDSDVMWGNYKAYIKGNKYLKNERALYGAQGVYRSTTVAPDAGRRTEVSTYAAQPGTLSQNDALRGTGGSAYFLRYQDITQGSETVSIETRDPVTGFVVAKTTLKSGTDYEFDYSQGVILLTQPLQSTTAGRNVYLIANYEYTPATTDVKGYAAGGRAQQWLGDHVRVGATVMHDYSGDANLDLGGGDVRLFATENTYVDFSMAHSRGNGFGYAASADGGLTYSAVKAPSGAKKSGNAFGVDARADLEDLTGGSVKGLVEGQYSLQQGGFATLDTENTSKREDIRLSGNASLSETTTLGVELSQSRSGGKTDREAKVIVGEQLTEKTKLEVGVKNTLKSGGTGSGGEYGRRTDLGAKLIHDIDEDSQIYGFGQVTAEHTSGRKRDDRVGVGGKTNLNEKVSVEGEASTGSAGIGGNAKLSYAPTAGTKYYVGYDLDPYRDLDPNSTFVSSGTDLGAFIVGANYRQSENLSFFAEDSYDMFGLKRTLAQSYGVEYAPFDNWTVGATAEFGRIIDDTVNATTGLKNSDFDRKAASASLGYRNANGNLGRVKAEARFEDSEDNTRDMNSYLLEGTVDLKAHEDWRFLANLDAVFSDATNTARSGRYAEGSVGFAYRPTSNDRLNALFKYTYLYDLPGADQVTVDGTLNGAQQRSHILSADAIYDVSDVLSVGAKYGVRMGETRARSGGGWTESTAHLGVLRADVNVDREWDVLLEGRMLWAPTVDSKKLGLLTAIYRHVGENFKIGVGYNFAQFSDDLRDLVADDHGVFVNAVGKF
jgi:hypothetical protein